LHSPAHPFSISPKKLSGQSSPDGDIALGAQAKDNDILPVLGQDSDGQDLETTESDIQFTPDMSSVPPAAGPSTPLRKGTGSLLPSMPTPFTPSINKTLKGAGLYGNGKVSKPKPLPESLSVAVLKSRLEGKKKIKYVPKW